MRWRLLHPALIAATLTTGCGAAGCPRGNICTWLGEPGVPGFDGDGLDRLDTRTESPRDVGFGGGEVYFVNADRHMIRRVSGSGLVETITGTGMPGDGPEGGNNPGCWEPSTCDLASTAWQYPADIVGSPTNTDQLYVAAWGNGRIHVIDLGAETVTWAVGSGERSFGKSDNLSEAILDLPSSIVFDDDGTMFTSDEGNDVVWQLTPDEELTVIAGTPRRPGLQGNGGLGREAKFHSLKDTGSGPGSKIDTDGQQIVIADSRNGQVRSIEISTGRVSLVAGAYTSAGRMQTSDPRTGKSFEIDAGSVPGYGGDGGQAADAVLNQPRDVAIGRNGDIYVADTGNHCVRRIRNGRIDTFAGQCGVSGYGGEGGPADQALLNSPQGVAVDGNGDLFIADTGNHIIRIVPR